MLPTPLLIYDEHKHVKGPDKSCNKGTYPNLLEYRSFSVSVHECIPV